ncbi:hypothetical protein CCM_09497 [Cordyceps militaris CM01]|uniref:Uncharacterized protein n=1 Tax=Cordyceps militaris (strain CM01) TaxID=983644 RepID=G3JUS4_CORMM|nr:uncharacterized protein CCM_09497 [Cordyceps militaris CM01]EGX87874.1 hypothetical protein CCM_09497 [Cordyceps militaris CM01]
MRPRTVLPVLTLLSDMMTFSSAETKKSADPVCYVHRLPQGVASKCIGKDILLRHGEIWCKSEYDKLTGDWEEFKDPRDARIANIGKIFVFNSTKECTQVYENIVKFCHGTGASVSASMEQFRQAILDMVEAGDSLEIESLANRLRPFRVETANNTAACRLKLVLEDGLAAGNLEAMADPALSTPPTTVYMGDVSDNSTDENALSFQMDDTWSEWLITPSSTSSPSADDYLFMPNEMAGSGSGEGDAAMCSGDVNTVMWSDNVTPDMTTTMDNFGLHSNSLATLGIDLCDNTFDASPLSSVARSTLPIQDSLSIPDLSAGRCAFSSRTLSVPRRVPLGSSSAESPVHLTELQRYIRSDCSSYIRENAERWSRDGLWHHSEFPNPENAEPGCHGLRTVYHCICKLDVRMEDDAIRNRIAIIVLHERYERNIQTAAAAYQATGQTSRGRGYASILVDNILAQIHGHEWAAASLWRKKELRAKFHDRKRYGKRWSILARSAGQGILFLCAPQLVAMV